MAEENKIYTTADFAAYYSGKMPEAEMHALEKAALEDPFLADALEGYAFTESAENDMAEIKNRLKEHNKKNKIFFLTSSNKGWWRAAAALIIIAGAGILFFNINKTAKENTLAENSLKPRQETNPMTGDTVSKNKEDTTQPEENAVTQNTAPAEKIFSENNAAAPVLPKMDQVAAVPSTGTFKGRADKYFNTVDDKNANAKEYILKGKVTDEDGEPVAAAVIKNKKTSAGTVTDSVGSFVLNSADSTINATASAMGYKSKNISLSKDKMAAVELNKSINDLEEVVVTGYGVQREVHKTGMEIKKNVDISPVEGTQQYDAYIAENIKRFYDSSATHATGTVVLSFELGKKGHPKNIFVVSSSCPACTATAIKILKDGPAWIGKKNHRYSRSITF